MDLEVSDRELSIIVEPEEPVSGLAECEWRNGSILTYQADGIVDIT